VVDVPPAAPAEDVGVHVQADPEVLAVLTGTPADEGAGVLEPQAEQPKTHRPPVIMDIHPEAVATYWDRIEDLVRSAINASPVQPKLETPADVLQSLIKGVYNLHLVIAESRIQLVLITMLDYYNRNAVCHVIYGAGEGLEHWIKHFRSQFCEGARMQNCRFIQIHVPDEVRGKIMERCGFVETSKTYTLEI